VQKIGKKYKRGLLSKSTTVLGHPPPHRRDFDIVRTAAGRSYSPSLPHFTECARRMGGKRGWVPVAASHYHESCGA